MTSNSKIRVLHLSTSHTGGAGIAARRLNKELNDHGIDSSFFAIKRRDYLLNSKEYYVERNITYRLLSYLSTLISKYTKSTTFFSIFSSPGISSRWIKSQIKKKNTIIHIHNWYNLLSINQFTKIAMLGSPIVITMHDERLLTGGCHVTLGCNQFENGCTKCPKVGRALRPKVQKNAGKFQLLFDKPVHNLRIVAPSNFMLRQSKKSFILKNQDIYFLSNPIPKSFTRFKSRINTVNKDKGFNVGVASANPHDPLKGSGIIYELSRKLLTEHTDISILYLRDFPENEHFKFWNKIGCLLVPSVGDNSPNIIHEAKLFGIPVIATNIGGISEMLFSGFDIAIELKSLSVDSLFNGIQRIRNRHLLEESVKRMQISHSAYLGDPVSQIIEIYRNISLID